MRRHARQGVSGFQKGLQVGQHFWPAAGDALQHLWVVLKVGVRDGQADQPGAVGRNIKGHAGMFGRVLLLDRTCQITAISRCKTSRKSRPAGRRK